MDKRVILVKLQGDLDIDEVTRNNREMLAKVSEGTPLVHIVIDDSQVGKVPVSLGQLAKIFTGGHPSMGWVIMVGPGSQLQNFLLGMLSKILRGHMHREPTLEAAITYLTERDISVPWHETNEETLSAS